MERSLDEKVVCIAGALNASGLQHAFGGALALAYYAEPRATIDVDVNVFVSPEDANSAFDSLEPLGVEIDSSAAQRARRDGQVRLRWDSTPIDLFFAYDAFHKNAAQHVRRVPFGDDEITILAPEDLLVCKAVFDRRKDWLDIEQMLVVTAGELDVSGARSWLVRIVGNDDGRLEKFDDRVRELLGG